MANKIAMMARCPENTDATNASPPPLAFSDNAQHQHRPAGASSM